MIVVSLLLANSAESDRQQVSANEFTQLRHRKFCCVWIKAIIKREHIGNNALHAGQLWCTI